MWKLRTDKKGRWALFKPYEYRLLMMLIGSRNEEIKSVDAWKTVSSSGLQISRASIINKLQEWAEDGLIERTTGIGKGGVHSKYIMTKKLKEVQIHIANKLIESLNSALTLIIVTQLH